MENKKEIKPFLEYTNGEERQFFHEGDSVICFTKSKICKGTIVAYSNYKENEDADPQCSVYLDTSKNGMSRSCEIINVADITYMCKNSAGDLFGCLSMDEKQDESRFINMIRALGHDKEKAEVMYEYMKKIISLYNISLSIMLANVIQGADLNVNEKNEEELIDISNKLFGVVAGVFQSITNVIKETRLPGIGSEDAKSQRQ